MNLIMLLSANIATSENVSTTAENVAKSNDYFGAFITILCCIFSCIVTWRIALKSIEKKKLTYQTHLFPLLSQFEDVDIKGMKMEYNGEMLKNPCFLTVDIVNTGNKSIDNPKITVGYDEDIRIMPAYLEDVPRGYESDWKFDPDHKKNNNCNIILNHINAKSTVKARFFLDNCPTSHVYVVCPMQDLEVIEGSFSRISQNLKKNPLWRKFNSFLTGFVCFFIYSYFALNGSIPLFNFLHESGWHIVPLNVYIYFFGVAAISLILNWCGEIRLDQLREQYGTKAILVELLLFIVSLVGIHALLYDLVLYSIQIIFAIIIILLHAFLIHRMWIKLFEAANR